MNGEKFLNKLYKDLNLSAEVKHTAKGTKDKNEAVKRYMDRLEYIQSKAANSSRLSDIELLKHLYHIKYVIKKDEKKIRIFGNRFVYNNYNNCKIILNGKKYKCVLMLRVNNDKIRQSSTYPKEYILEPTTDEIRPYRILFKKC